MAILSILEEFLKEIEKHNPYKLIIKGGTALSLFYFNHHRESEDLDFDADIKYLKEHAKIESYFIDILEKLKEKGIIRKFSKGKSGLAATNRYHMKIQLETHKIFYTKIDVDFIKINGELRNKGELFLYLPERLFITKMITFTDRKEFKDLYDISHLISRISIDTFKNNLEVISLIDQAINTILNEDLKKLFKQAFKNVDLGFKNLNESQIDMFNLKILRNLRVLKNKLR
ncbi:nucleotidyl transferase AbiEii/AbiGii toxin family protein [Candidatus Woesearchaeota archaeon]|nr:nucleotidyl transferase AbiEii/AbiGii toxin family protein [Candidatus Woesearchaeota archaeon]